MASAGAESPLS